VAATRKVAVTAYHSAQLQKALLEWPAHIDAVQAHFEGVFYGGAAATEKAAAAISVLLDGIPKQKPDPSIGRAIERLRENSGSDYRELGEALEAWRDAKHDDETFERAGRDIRNAVTHDFSEKRHAPPGDWFYGVRDRGRWGRYHSGRIDGFPVAYASHIERLRPLIFRVAQVWRLDLEAASAERGESPA
jgi:hypothetical protein